MHLAPAVVLAMLPVIFARQLSWMVVIHLTFATFVASGVLRARMDPVAARIDK